MSNWVLVFLFTVLGLAVPLAILLGAFRPAGSVLVSGIASLLASAVFWIVRGGIVGIPAQTDILTSVMVLIGSIVLLIVTWALALNAAAQSRRWWWFVLVTLTGAVSIATLLIALTRPDPCMFGPIPDDSPFFAPCRPSNAIIPLLILAGFLVGPVTAMLSGLRASSLRRRGPPEGLSVSSLGATSDPDAESEVRSEQL